MEGLSVVAPKPNDVPLQFTDPVFNLINIGCVETLGQECNQERLSGGSHGAGDGKSITVEDTSFLDAPEYASTGALQAQYLLAGQLTLLNRCVASGNNNFPISTSDTAKGPNVTLNFKVTGGPHTNLEPHQRWATGLLVDNASAPTGAISFHDRGTMGTGHGWTMGWGVIWNCDAAVLQAQQAPGTNTWVIGSSGQPGTPPFPIAGADATVDSPGKRVDPDSLYLAQLRDRLGNQALANLGY